MHRPANRNSPQKPTPLRRTAQTPSRPSRCAGRLLHAILRQPSGPDTRQTPASLRFPAHPLFAFALAFTPVGWVWARDPVRPPLPRRVWAALLLAFAFTAFGLVCHAFFLFFCFFFTPSRPAAPHLDGHGGRRPAGLPPPGLGRRRRCGHPTHPVSPTRGGPQCLRHLLRRRGRGRQDQPAAADR